MGICSSKAKEVKDIKVETKVNVITKVEDVKFATTTFHINDSDKFFSIYRLG